VRVLYVENSYGEMGGSLVSLLEMAKEIVAQNAILPLEKRVEPCFYFLYPNLLLDQFRALGPVVLEQSDYAEFGRPVALPRALRGIVSRLPTPARRAVGEILPLALRVAFHARRLRADLIHSNCRLGSNEYAILGARLAGVPVVAHERLFYRVSRLTRVFVGAVDAVVAISRAVAQSLTSQGVRARRLEVVFNGIDIGSLARFRDRPRDAEAPFRVGMVGRITRWKGQHVLIDAARRLAEGDKAIEFHLAGDAPPLDDAYLEALRETVKDSELDNRIVFHGNVKAIYDFMAGMDILVHGSVDPEPFGRVIMEAMAIGKPTIATRGGAVEEICTNDHDALVVDPGRPDLLAAAIARLKEEPATMARLGANAMQTIEDRFSLQVTAQQVRTLYEDVRAKPASPPLLEAATEFLLNNPLSSRRRVRSRARGPRL
jgi:glycosyltransferase involved in cell wall biosynthesis